MKFGIPFRIRELTFVNQAPQADYQLEASWVMVRSVAVIGAGPSGLSAIKSLVECGLSVVCFEMTGEIGGNWRFSEAAAPANCCKSEEPTAHSHSAAYASLNTNSSKVGVLQTYLFFGPTSYSPRGILHP